MILVSRFSQLFSRNCISNKLVDMRRRKCAFSRSIYFFNPLKTVSKIPEANLPLIVCSSMRDCMASEIEISHSEMFHDIPTCNLRPNSKIIFVRRITSRAASSKYLFLLFPVCFCCILAPMLATICCNRYF